MLTMDLDPSPDPFTDHLGGCELAVDRGAARAVAEDVTPDQRLLSTHHEQALDRGPLRALANRGRRRPTAKKELETFDQDRLTGPGFARQDIEARPERNLDVVDQGVLRDPQASEHDAKRGRESA